MSLASSLTNRIFLAGALLVVVSIGVAIYRVQVSVASRAEDELRGGLEEAAALVDELSRTQFADFIVKGSLIADLPVLKGATSTSHAPTVQPIADDYQQRIGADLFVVLGRSDEVLARSGRIRPEPAGLAGLVAACRQSPDGTTFWRYPGGVLHAAAIPMEPGPTPLGTLIVGFGLDEAAALRIKAVTNSEIAFLHGADIVASTLPPRQTAALGPAHTLEAVFTRELDGEAFIGRVQPLATSGELAEPAAIVLRSRTKHLSFLAPLRLEMVLTGLAAVLVATVVGYAIARTVTRPLRALSATMREIAATGDLTRPVPAAGRWDDEDARLLSTTFGQLTGALARFQREHAQRERLSSLGRLSTVIAHEIRNPLMIIKAAVRGLRKHSSPEVLEAATSLDEEVRRLDHLVTDVLDFARPIAFDRAPADLAAICRDAAHAAGLAADAPHVTFESETPSAPAVTDAERLRSVLVNLLSNAQAAVRARPTPPPAGPPVRVRLSRPALGGRWRIEVIDQGEGIRAEDLPRVFEPFFTTRRGGSGVGLALARNVVEGLGGAIAIESRVDAGTTVRLDLPDLGPAGEAKG
jgi:signal transduction histidine kinase